MGNEDGKEKPQVIKFYDFTMGGADIVDHLDDYYTAPGKSNLWLMVALFYMLETSMVN